MDRVTEGPDASILIPAHNAAAFVDHAVESALAQRGASVEVIAVDDAHRMRDAGVAVNAWQRAQMRRWRAGDTAASPIYWAALATFTVGGAR